MAADVQGGMLARQAHGIFERISVGHQRSRREDPVRVRVDDAPVHVGGETEVIRIDDQAFQNRASLMRRNFFGFARKSLNNSCSSRVAPFMLSYSAGFTSNCPMVPWPELTLSMVMSTLPSVVFSSF